MNACATTHDLGLAPTIGQWIFEILAPVVRTFDRLASWKTMIQSAEQRAEVEPAFALEQQEGLYILKAVVPGASAAELKVEVNGSALRIHGRTQVRFSDGRSFGYVRERPVDQTFVLPPDAAGERVECALQPSGMLLVSIPRVACLPVTAVDSGKADEAVLG